MKTNKDLIIEPNAAIEGRKYSEEKPWSCKYCYWWGGKKKGCSLKQCHYLLPEKKKAVKTTKITGIAKKTRLKKGKTLTLKPAVTPLTSLQKVTYKSSNKKVATVTSKGVIRARKKGTAVITVKSGRKTVKCRITVK